MICVDLPLEDGSCEKVWVKRRSYNTGEINNLPFLTKVYKYKDVIEFDPQTLNAIRVVKDGGYAPTQLVRYKGGFSEAKAEWEAKGYEVEGMVLGILAVARKFTKTIGGDSNENNR